MESGKFHHLWESKTNRRIPYEKKKRRNCLEKGLGRPLQIAQRSKRGDSEEERARSRTFITADADAVKQLGLGHTWHLTLYFQDQCLRSFEAGIAPNVQLFNIRWTWLERERDLYQETK